MIMEYKVDPNRSETFFDTGIFVRAKNGTKWDSYDIAQLERESLHAWLRSRDGKNLWAENVVLLLLGYEPMEDV
jgi:hypothetical protein